MVPQADLAFYRCGEVSKILSKFFWTGLIGFPRSQRTKHKTLKIHAKAFSGTFWKTLTKKLLVLARASPWKLINLWPKKPLEKFKVRQPLMDISKCTKADPLGRQGIESLRRKPPPQPLPPPPKYATAIYVIQYIVAF